MTEVGEDGFEVALGESDFFAVLMTNMTVRESKSDLVDVEKEARDDVEVQFDVPFRGSSLMEEEQDKDDGEVEPNRREQQTCQIEIVDSLAKSTSMAEENDRFHPDLMQFLQAEGQEAMWMEDEVSTVTSVFVQPVASKRFSFLQSRKAVQPDKIHVRKKKITKAVVLLPPRGDELEQTLVDANAQEKATVDTLKPGQLNKDLVKSGSNAEDSVSTLGLHTDTFEYQLGAPSHAPSQLTSYHNMDLMSISSLNEILDGTMEEAIEKTLSPRQMLSEIHIPRNKTPRSGSASFQPPNISKELPVTRTQSESGKKDTKKILNWGLLKKFRRGSKVGRSEQGDDASSFNTPEEPTLPSIEEHEEDEIPEAMATHESQDGEKMPSFELKPSEEVPSPHLPPVVEPPAHEKPHSLEPPADEKKTVEALAILTAHSMISDSKESKASRYHIIIEQKPSQDDSSVASSVSSSCSDSTQSTDVSEVITSRSAESIYRAETAKSDWDHSKNFRRNPKASAAATAENASDHEQEEETSIYEKAIASTTSPSSDATPESATPQPTGPGLVHASLEAARMSMLQKSLVHASIEAARMNMLQKSIANEVKDETPQPTGPGVVHASVEAARMSMLQKSIANLSGEDESTQDTTAIESNVIQTPVSKYGQTPISKYGTSVGTNGTLGTKDIRSTLGNAGVETIVESVAPSLDKSASSSVQSFQSPMLSRSAASDAKKYMPLSNAEQNQLRSDPDGSKDDSTVAPTVVIRRKISQLHSRENESVPTGSRSRKSESSFHPPIADRFKGEDESTRGEDDSLIDFVISPHRANIVTPGGTKPFVTANRRLEPTKIASLPAIIENLPLNGASHEVKDQEPVRPMKRFPVIFGNRMNKAFQHTKSPVPEKPFFENLSEVQNGSQATSREEEVSLPSSANGNTDTTCTKSGGNDVDGEDETSTVLLQKVLSEAVSKANEANMEAMTAPFPHKRYRHRKVNADKRPIPNDLVEAIRMQSGREPKRPVRAPRESISDAPGISFSVDPEIDTNREDQAPTPLDPTNEGVDSIRVLAPTPRNRPVVDDQNAGKENECSDASVSRGEDEQVKYAQRKVTERLYGPIESTDSFIGNHTKVEVNKGVYIGDLLGKSGVPDVCAEKPSAIAEDSTEVVMTDKENEQALDAASPKAIVAPKRARRSMFGLRRNILSTEH
jgi:hypothetical protein